MERFIQQRHKKPEELSGPGELVLACAPFRSRVNLSRIVRVAGSLGIDRIYATCQTKVDAKIARQGREVVTIHRNRTLVPVLQRLKESGYKLVGLEQTTNSQSLFTYTFPERTVLVIGSEREGLSEAALKLLDDVVEIPVFGMPYSYNIATATTMAIYEYCRQKAIRGEHP